MAKQPNRSPSKIRPVPIDKMRVPPALVTQRPFIKAHGDNLAANLDLDKLGYPVVNFRDGAYWILDGQHRIYALKENGLGKEVLDCEVFENLSDAQMAHIFLGRDARRSISPFAKFHIACTAEEKRETGIRRAVESQGLKISVAKEEGCIGAVTSLGKVYDMAGGGRTGETVLGQVLRTIRDGFASDPAAFDAQVIQGLGLVFNRYNGRTNEKALAESLATSAHGVRGLLRRAETQRERTGNAKAQCVAAAVVEAYNKQANKSSRLPSWWKSEQVEQE